MTPGLGAFGVVRTNGWVAWGIRLVTRSEANHAFVHVGGGHIVEANPSGAAVGRLDEYPHAIWSTMPLTQDQRERIVVETLKLVGTPYSWVDDVCIGLADIFGWHVPGPVRHRLNRRDRLMCSALVDTAYHNAGIDLWNDGRIPGDVSPGDLLTLIQRQGVAA